MIHGILDLSCVMGRVGVVGGGGGVWGAPDTSVL